MKKRILTIALAFVLCLSLCSCSYIDELRAGQFIWGDDEQTILLSRDGKEYRKLPNPRSLNLYFEDYHLGYIVDPEIPLLLANTFAEYYVYLDDDYNYVEMYASKLESSDVFCRSERYDETVDFIENKTGSIYYYEYYDYEDFELETRDLSHYEQSIVNAILKRGDYETVSKEYHTYEHSVEIMRCNEERDLSLVSYYIELINQQYYVVIYSNSSVNRFRVPYEDRSTFDLILREYYTN